ncbi:MAG: LLM class flavin-dependent oxidoreductase, partial [Actinomycetota bacterium]|nr:LLM class flavin-dependent oxidoreductase [Actinomycetota bacterium]
PLLTAEDLVTVAAFCAGRLDVGLGRGSAIGAGSGALRHLVKNDHELDRALRELVSVLGKGCELVEALGDACQTWLHGAGGRSAELAAALDTHYCHGLFLNPDLDTCLRALQSYRADAASGLTAVALAVAANTDPARAQADAEAQPFAVTAGTPQHCADTMLNVLRMTGANEVIIAEVSADTDDHLRAVDGVYQAFEAVLATEGQE